MTILEALNALQEPYRTQAIYNYENDGNEFDEMDFRSISFALHNSFVWGTTFQGHEYWEELYNNLEKMGL